MTIQATIQELGNGFPDPNDYAQGDDGNLYLVINTGRICTSSSPGEGDFMYADVEPADWDELPGDQEPFPAMVILPAPLNEDENDEYP